MTKMTRKQMDREYEELMSWTKTETSTMRGMHKFQNRIDELLMENTELTVDEENEVFAIRDELVDMFPTLYPHIGDMRHRLNSEQILEDISRLYQQRLSHDQIIETMRKELEKEYEAQQGGDEGFPEGSPTFRGR